MKKRFKLVVVDSKYCHYLRKYEKRVPYNDYEKKLRPFVGILFKINGFEYFAPLSSPKEKHLYMKNTIDFMKIDHGRLGVINFNNMVPLMNINYKLVNIDNSSKDERQLQYQNLLKTQLKWMNLNYDRITKRAQKLYNLYKQHHLNENIYNRCCDFQLLELKCMEYYEEQKCTV